MEQCIAIADYDAMAPDEISFKRGDTITVVAKGASSGFWEGMVNREACNGAKHKKEKSSKSEANTDGCSSSSAAEGEKRGLFPNCFVTSNLRRQVAPTFLDKAMALYDYTARDSSELSMKKHDVLTVVRPSSSPGWWCGVNESAAKRMKGLGSSDDHTIGMTCGTKKRPLMFPVNFVTSKIVQATFAFQGRQAHELSFSAGDVILVHRRWNDGWWEGTIGCRRGIFPSNYSLPNVSTTEPPFFCPRCKTPFANAGSSLAECKECAKNEEIVESMVTALQDHKRGLLPRLDLFSYVDLEPNQGGRTALLSVADTVDRSVRKEKQVLDGP